MTIRHLRQFSQRRSHCTMLIVAVTMVVATMAVATLKAILVKIVKAMIMKTNQPINQTLVTKIVSWIMILKCQFRLPK